jgi:hypothetical protein
MFLMFLARTSRFAPVDPFLAQSPLPLCRFLADLFNSTNFVELQFLSFVNDIHIIFFLLLLFCFFFRLLDELLLTILVVEVVFFSVKLRDFLDFALESHVSLL